MKREVFATAETDACPCLMDCVGLAKYCRRPGRVDMVDLVGHTVHMSCSICGTLWLARSPLSEQAD